MIKPTCFYMGEGDRWRVARTLDSGPIQQELHRSSCKQLSQTCCVYFNIAVFYDSAITSSQGPNYIMESISIHITYL